MLFKRYPYLFNLLIVLVLLEITRTLDWFAWMEPYPGKAKDILLSHLFEFLAFIPVILLMIPSYLWAIKRKQVLLLSILVLVFAVLGPTLIRYTTAGLVWLFWKTEAAQVTLDVLKKYTPGCLSAILFLSATFYLTWLQQQFARQRDAMHKAETLAREVQLKMLHYQINPHFLFNVLNSIHALIDENAVKAKKLVVEMSDYYRYTLNKLEQNITVGKEVEAVVKYLEIQKTRFEENFDYEISVSDAAKEIRIPSFVIHLLIENAVKYGIRTNDQRLQIRLLADLQGSKLMIRVLNTGKLNPDTVTQKGTGSGIENIKNRLSLFCDDRYSFSLTEAEGWVSAAIEMEV